MRGRHGTMRLTPARAHRVELPDAPARTMRGSALDIALVNNMPDPALRATEHQFRSLIAAAAGRMRVHVHPFTLPSIPRGADASLHTERTYGRFDDLFSHRFDAVIVTGNEPRAARLDAEPYWSDLTRLIEWVATNASTSLWSCLAAHAAVLHLHGIQRSRLPEKLSGVFSCGSRGTDPLLQSMNGPSPVPHSRLNTLRRDDLLANGYRILRESPEAGVDLFTWGDRSRFVFLQGHPEYDIDTLAREYRRDVGRFLRGESDTYPPEPHEYFSDEARLVLSAFRRRAVANRDPALLEVFPHVAAPFAIKARWQPATVQLFRNWLGVVAANRTASARLPS